MGGFISPRWKRCIARRKRENSRGGPDPTPAPEAELSDRTPAHIQLVRVEMLLKPGSKQPLQVRVYNKLGQVLSTQKPNLR